MSSQIEWTSERVRQALVQKLENLQRAGVKQLPGLPAPAPTVVDHPAPRASASGASESLRPEPVPQKPAEAPAPAIAAEKTPAPSADPVADLAVLQREVVRCERCDELARRRTQTVFGVGDPNARLCFFGEAPGADEDLQGEPFVGAAGQLLTKIIQACTLRREEVYILNVLKCRPPGNRNPEPSEVASCRVFFERQFEIIRPEFICCLGAVAAQSLLRTTQSVGRLRGQFHEYRGARVLVTYHPSYLLRQPSAKRAVWEDMKLLMKAMGLEIPKR